jgi:glycosyltransferase involved in cell wall biosynthesis
LVIAGGKGWQEDAFYDAIEKCPAKEDIQLIGYIYTPEKNTLYKNAAAFLFPSLYEGFGIPPLEAMYHNCPVVASNAASLPEVCGEAAAYVDPLDAESIAGGIWKVVSDEAFAQDMRKKGIEREKLFTWESSVEKLKSICKEVLNE